MRSLLLYVVFFAPFFMELHGQATIYPKTEGVSASEDYTVYVNGKSVMVYASPIPAAFCSFDLLGPVDVTIITKRDVKWVDIRPLSSGILPHFKDSIITFRLEKPMQLSIELNGSIKTPLFIFANPPEKFKPARTDKDVLFFEAGKVHYAGIITVKSNQSVYIEGGAVVVGVIKAEKAQHIKIYGRGIMEGTYNNRFDDSLIRANALSQLPKPTNKNYHRFIELKNCEDITLSGIILSNGTTWQVVPIQCHKVVIDNLKIISDQPSDDGIDVVHCKNVIIEKCFIRTKDDCIVVKSYMNNPDIKGTDSVLVRESVFWNALWGNALEIGFELNAAEVKNIWFKNNDIIHVEAGAAISIHNAGKAVVHHISFEDIRLEDVRQKLFDVAIFRSVYSPDGSRDPEIRKRDYLHGAWDGVLKVPGDQQAYHASFRGTIHDIVFKNISVVEGTFPYSIFYGFDKEKNISGVTITNLKIYGKKITEVGKAKFYLEHTENLRLQ